MYTMLMMMAVSSGGEASAFGGHRGGCNGNSCTGAVVVASCQGNSCSGGRVGFLGGLCHKKDNGSCQGTVASCTGVVVAPVSSCTGVVVDNCGCQGSGRGGFLRSHFHKNSCNGGSCQGSSCTGAVIVAPTSCTGGAVTPVVMPPMNPAPTPMPKTEAPKPKTTE